MDAAVRSPVSRCQPSAGALAAILALAMADPAAARDARNAAAEHVAPVEYVYASVSNTSTVGTQCWQTLIPQRSLLQEQHDAKPFLLRNWQPLLGAALGSIGGVWLLHKMVSAAAFKLWALPVMAGSGLAGYETGPGGPLGALAGGSLTYSMGLDVGAWLGKGDKTKNLHLGRYNWQPTLIGGLVGLVGGMALWNMIFPPDVPAAPADDPNGVIEAESFAQKTVCGPVRKSTPSASGYRVGYRLDGEIHEVSLPYDPGEAVRLDAQGNVMGKANLR